MNLDLPDFAIGGERGIDLFRRREDRMLNRARFTCLATVLPAGSPPGAFAQALRHDDGRLMLCHDPGARRAAAELWVAVDRYQALSALHTPLRLGDATAFPSSATDPASLAPLFPYIEFLRERLLAEMTLARFQAALAEAPQAAAMMEPGELASHLRLALDFNMLARGAALAPLLHPLLTARAQSPDLPEALAAPTGYALRLLGDLRLRAGSAAAATQALALFEAALALGENPFRRRRVIEAAAAAGRIDTCLAHLRAWPAARPLPEDLRALGQAMEARAAATATAQGAESP